MCITGKILELPHVASQSVHGPCLDARRSTRPNSNRTSHGAQKQPTIIEYCVFCQRSEWTRWANRRPTLVVDMPSQSTGRTVGATFLTAGTFEIKGSTDAHVYRTNAKDSPEYHLRLRQARFSDICPQHTSHWETSWSTMEMKLQLLWWCSFESNVKLFFLYLKWTPAATLMQLLIIIGIEIYWSKNTENKQGEHYSIE